ncbi:MAG: pyridoxal-phosphate dependent enzyme [Deltaproteobacteria bacterium]|nr:pyridoxal-phosphate dependent enzyme [Deltaproteobacteria bacterium]
MGFISPTDIEALAKVLAPYITKTPLVTGGGALRQLFLKREDLQLTNSFTVRAALGILLGLSEEQKSRGMILTTPGNLGWGLVYGLQCLNLKMRLTIVIPKDAVEAKRLGLLQALHPGISVVQDGFGELERYEIVRKIALRDGLEELQLKNRKDEVAAKGSIAIEILEQLSFVAGADHKRPLRFFCPIGSGALAAGCAIVLKNAMGECVKIIGAEPASANDFALLFHQRTVSTAAAPMSVADSLRSPKVRDEYRSTLLALMDDVVEVSETEIIEAMQLLKESSQIVSEPSSAISVAGYLKNPAFDGNSVALLTASNVDTDRFQFLKSAL